MSSADEREKGRPVTRVSQGGKYIPMDFSLVGGARGEGGGWSFVSLGVAALAITGLLPTVSQVAINDDDVAQRSGH